MNKLNEMFVRMHIAKEEAGQGLVEYALILVLVAVVAIAGVTLLGTQISTVIASVTAGLS